MTISSCVGFFIFAGAFCLLYMQYINPQRNNINNFQFMMIIRSTFLFFFKPYDQWMLIIFRNDSFRILFTRRITSTYRRLYKQI